VTNGYVGTVGRRQDLAQVLQALRELTTAINRLAAVAAAGGEVCAICGGPPHPDTDHPQHRTSEIRSSSIDEPPMWRWPGGARP
jgi:hypothetical protein